MNVFTKESDGCKKRKTSVDNACLQRARELKFLTRDNNMRHLLTDGYAATAGSAPASPAQVQRPSGLPTAAPSAAPPSGLPISDPRPRMHQKTDELAKMMVGNIPSTTKPVDDSIHPVETIVQTEPQESRARTASLDIKLVNSRQNPEVSITKVVTTSVVEANID